jgi:hypothetical protein
VVAVSLVLIATFQQVILLPNSIFRATSLVPTLTGGVSRETDYETLRLSNKS